MSRPNPNDYNSVDGYANTLKKWEWRREQIAREILANVAGNVMSIAFIGGAESDEETQSRRTGMAVEATALAESLIEVGQAMSKPDYQNADYQKNAEVGY